MPPKKGKINIIKASEENKSKQIIKDIIPVIETIKWKKIDKTPYSEIVDVNKYKTEYKITKDLIEFVDKNKTNLLDEFKNNKTNKQIYYIYKAHNDKKIIYGNTSLLLGEFVIKSIIYRENTYLSKIFNTIEGITIEIENILLLDDKENQEKKILGEIIDKYNINNNKKITQLEEIYEIVKDLINKEKTEERKIFIYKVKNKATKKNGYFYDYDDKKKVTKTLMDNKKEIINFVVDEPNKYELEKIEEQKIKLDIEGKLITDKYIEKEKTIDDGLNIKYNIYDVVKKLSDDKIKRLIFLMMQKNILNNEFKDPINNYNELKGYIYQIKNGSNQRSFIGYVLSNKVSLKTKLNEKYEASINSVLNGKNLNKFTKLISEVKFNNLDIIILDKKTKKNRWLVSKKAQEYIKKYKTDSKEGYNAPLIKRNILNYSNLTRQKDK